MKATTGNSRSWQKIYSELSLISHSALGHCSFVPSSLYKVSWPKRLDKSVSRILFACGVKGNLFAFAGCTFAACPLTSAFVMCRDAVTDDRPDSSGAEQRHREYEPGHSSNDDTGGSRAAPEEDLPRTGEQGRADHEMNPYSELKKEEVEKPGLMDKASLSYTPYTPSISWHHCASE